MLLNGRLPRTTARAVFRAAFRSEIDHSALRTGNPITRRNVPGSRLFKENLRSFTRREKYRGSFGHDPKRLPSSLALGHPAPPSSWILTPGSY
jgi:hypothetical protein